MIQLPSDINNGWFVLLFSLLIFTQLTLFIRYVYWFIKSRSWRGVTGTVLSIDFKKASLKNETNDSLAIQYSYKIGSKEYINTKLVLSDYACSWLVSPSRKLIKNIYMQYQVGAPIKVFFSETDPCKSVLDTKFDIRILISSPIFFGFLLVMLLESLGLYKII
jgi:hypothetical protein